MKKNWLWRFGHVVSLSPEDLVRTIQGFRAGVHRAFVMVGQMTDSFQGGPRGRI